jgi:phosphatidylglycerol lysyltransferase
MRKLQKHPSLRAQLRRAANKGVRIEEWDAERAASNQELRDCLRQWLEARPFPPLHFLVEPGTLDRPEGRRIFVAVVSNLPIGYALLSPIPQRNGWLIEQFVRRPSAPNGTAELMVTRAVEAIAAKGYEYVTLGLAPLSRHAGIPGEGQPHLRFLFGLLRLHGNRFYNFSGLDFFKSKFDPDAWEPVYALADRRRLSFRMLYAIAAAFSNGSPMANLLKAILRAGVQEARWLLGRR